MNIQRFGSGLSRKAVIGVSVVLLSFVLTGPGVLAVGGGVPGSLGTTYGGRSYGIGIETVFGGTYFGDTGSLPSDGGALFADFADVGTDVASGLVYDPYTRGFMDVALGEPATSDLTLLPGDALEVGASFAYARSWADCGGVSGTSEILDLTIGGVGFGVSGAPNEVIYSIPGVFTLIANEQIDSSFGTTHGLTVNALHLSTPGLDVIVSSAYSSVTCSGFGGGGGIFSGGASGTRGDSVGTMSSGGGLPTPTHLPPPKDFMTGGGFFFANGDDRCNGIPFSDDRINFGFNAGPRPGTWRPDGDGGIKGHLNLVDHGPNCAIRHIQGTDVTFYEPFGDTQRCRRWGDSNGAAKVNGVPGYNYAVVTCDYGEPGRSDRFAIDVWTGLPGSDPNSENVVYHADNGVSACIPNGCQGTLPGGNIQLHSFG